MLAKNQRGQFGLRAGASEEAVQAARQRYGSPNFEEGSLVSLWEPETRDKSVWKPTKLQYKYRGPYRVLGRDGEHFHIDRK